MKASVFQRYVKAEIRESLGHTEHFRNQGSKKRTLGMVYWVKWRHWNRLTQPATITSHQLPPDWNKNVEAIRLAHPGVKVNIIYDHEMYDMGKINVQGILPTTTGKFSITIPRVPAPQNDAEKKCWELFGLENEQVDDATWAIAADWLEERGCGIAEQIREWLKPIKKGAKI